MSSTPTLPTLPPELRLRIYIYAFLPSSSSPEVSSPSLQQSRGRLVIDTTTIQPELIPPLCRTSHTLLAEALPVYIQSRNIAPTQPYVAPRFGKWLERRTDGGMDNIRSLDFSGFALERGEGLSDLIGFVSRCKNVRELWMRFDYREFQAPPAAIAGMMDWTPEDRHLPRDLKALQPEPIIALPNLVSFHLFISELTIAPPTPIPEELRGILGGAAMRTDRRGGAMVNRARVGSRRIMCINPIMDIEITQREMHDRATITVEEVRKWYRYQWRDLGRDVWVGQ